jgi:hypothetical protein
MGAGPAAEEEEDEEEEEEEEDEEEAMPAARGAGERTNPHELDEKLLTPRPVRTRLSAPRLQTVGPPLSERGCLREGGRVR